MSVTKSKLSIIGICAGMSVMAMIFSMVNTALPTIHKELHSSLAQLQWVMNIFGILTCSTLVFFGRFADIIGRKKIFLGGLCAQAVAMLGSGIAYSISQIIFFQAIAGIGNAIILSISQVMLVQVYGEQHRHKAIGIWAANIGFSLAIGPLLGGLLTSVIGWRAIFLLPLPIIMLSIMFVSLFSDESKNTEDPPKLDIPGVILLALTISCFTLAVVQAGIWRASIIVILAIISLVAFINLLIVERKAEQPIIREDLFTNRRFVLASIANCCLCFFVWAVFFLLPLFLQTEMHYSAFITGLIMLFITIPLGILAPQVSKLYHLLPVKYILLPGFVALIISALLQLHFKSSSHWLLFISAALLFGIGWSFVWGPSTTTAISTLSQERAGIAAGTFVTIQEIGGTIGLAITVSVARSHTTFLTGFHDGMWVLITISLIGFIAALLIRQPNTA